MKERIVFMDIKLAIDYEDKPHALYAIVMNWDGKILFQSRITPRERIKQYFYEIHGINEGDAIGKMDEIDAMVELRKYYNGQIIIGHEVFNKLKAIKARFS